MSPVCFHQLLNRHLQKRNVATSRLLFRAIIEECFISSKSSSRREEPPTVESTPSLPPPPKSPPPSFSSAVIRRHRRHLITEIFHPSAATTCCTASQPSRHPLQLHRKIWTMQETKASRSSHHCHERQSAATTKSGQLEITHSKPSRNKHHTKPFRR